jgi:hypothetical protein
VWIVALVASTLYRCVAARRHRRVSVSLSLHAVALPCDAVALYAAVVVAVRLPVSLAASLRVPCSLPWLCALFTLHRCIAASFFPHSLTSSLPPRFLPRCNHPLPKGRNQVRRACTPTCAPAFAADSDVRPVRHEPSRARRSDVAALVLNGATHPLSCSLYPTDVRSAVPTTTVLRVVAWLVLAVTAALTVWSRCCSV